MLSMGIMHNRLDTIAKLRKLTGLSFNLCKQAYDITNGVFDDSLAYLKKCGHTFNIQNKSLDNSIVFSYCIHNCTGIYKLKCQSDFAARSETITNLCSKIGSYIIQSEYKNNYINYEKSEKIKYVDDILNSAALELKEPLNLQQFIILSPKNNFSFIGKYVHGTHNFRPFEGGKAGFGASIVEIELINENQALDKNVEELANEIAIHVYANSDVDINDITTSPIIRANKFSEIYSKIVSDGNLKKIDEPNLTFKSFINALKSHKISLKIRNFGLLTNEISLWKEL